MAALRHQVEAHIESEESELFPLLRDAGVDTAALGEALERARAQATTRDT